MDFEFLKLRNILAVAVAASLEYGLSTANGVAAFAEADSWRSFAALLAFFVVLFWIVERLFKWIARRGARRSGEEGRNR